MRLEGTAIACPRCRSNWLDHAYDVETGDNGYRCRMCGLTCDASDLPLPELEVSEDEVNAMLDAAAIGEGL